MRFHLQSEMKFTFLKNIMEMPIYQADWPVNSFARSHIVAGCQLPIWKYGWEKLLANKQKHTHTNKAKNCNKC